MLILNVIMICLSPVDSDLVVRLRIRFVAFFAVSAPCFKRALHVRTGNVRGRFLAYDQDLSLIHISEPTRPY